MANKYEFYVVMRDTGLVLAGNEFKSDALDARRDLPVPLDDTIVLSRKTVQSRYGQIRWATKMRSEPSRSWNVRYVDKISPRDSDVGGPVSIPDEAMASRKTLGAALRKAGIMSRGTNIRSMRTEGDKVVVFPAMPGFTTYWHSIILTPAAKANGSRRQRAKRNDANDDIEIIVDVVRSGRGYRVAAYVPANASGTHHSKWEHFALFSDIEDASRLRQKVEDAGGLGMRKSEWYRAGSPMGLNPYQYERSPRRARAKRNKRR